MEHGHMEHIESLVEECAKTKDFKGTKFKSILAKINGVFDRGHGESCKRACDVILDKKLLSHIAALWKESDSEKADKDVVTTIKTLIWYCSDSHVEFCKSCVLDKSILKLLIDDLKKYALDLHKLEDVETRNGIRADFGILHNFLRHEPSAVETLKSLEGDSLRIVACFRDSRFHIMRVLSSVVLAFCGKSLPIDERDCDFLINMINVARHEADHVHKGQRFDLDEILQFITKLVARNDKNKYALVDANLLKSLDGIITESNPSEILMCLELLWQLAITESTKQSLVREQGIVQSIEDYYNDAPDDAKKECASLLHALKSTTSAKSKKHIMLSYHWNSQETILELERYLVGEGHSVWIDVKQKDGSTLQSMADAVENADIVLMGITENYYKSPTCRMEAHYAYTRRIPLLPLLLEKNYRPSGWLSILMGARPYVDLTDGSRNGFMKVSKKIHKMTNN